MKAEWILVLALLLQAGQGVGARAQSRLPEPSPVPNPHLPVALDDGIISRTEVSAISPHLRGGISWSAGGTGLKRTLSEKDPNSTNDWYSIEITESVPYTISAVGSRQGGREVYVAGVNYDGDVIIEKWTYGPRNKGWMLQAPSAPLPIGQPMPEFVPVENLNGTAWVKPPSTTGRPAVKNTLWSSSSAPILGAMEVDPEGRYLLAVAYPSGDVLQFDLEATPIAPVVILSASQEPYLDKASLMVMWHHSTEGRKCIISKKLGGWTEDDSQVILSDANNDGVFEANAFYDATQWQAAGYDVYGTFRRYWNTGLQFNWDE